MLKKNVVIFGGQLFNKGAQAMTFITVDEIAKRMPDHNVILFSSRDYKRIEHEKAQYKFGILPNPRYRILLLATLSRRLKWLKKLATEDTDKEIIDALHSADYFLDISGYALGSDWGCENSIGYCRKLNYAKSCGVKVYLMPQSFGPFEYKGSQAKRTLKQIEKSLPNAELIMAREEEGYLLLKNMFKLNNVIKTYDMVLQNKGIDIDSIYNVVPTINDPVVESGSVAIVPNSKTFKYSNSEEQFHIYDTLVSVLIQNHKYIYFLIHSSEDRDICNQLYNRYKEKYDRCVLINDELNCIEFDKTVSKFDFIIASRYHSIVHAYRNSIPAIVLGWAVKYKELMDLFDQGGYQFNIREKVDLNYLTTAINRMCDEHIKESASIREKLEIIQRENVFDNIV